MLLLRSITSLMLFSRAVHVALASFAPSPSFPILGDPGGDSEGERKSKRKGNMARRKVKNGKKSLWGQCLARPVPNCRRHSAFWFVPENFCVFLPNQKAERRQPFGTGLVRHCPQGLFSPFFSFLRAIFSRPFRLSLTPTICPWVSEDVPSLWMCFGKYLHIFLLWGSQCEGTWWVPLKWLSWLLSWLACGSLQVYKALSSWF